MWRVFRGLATPWDMLLHLLCADDRDDFCNHLLQFRWFQDPSTVQNDVGVGGKMLESAVNRRFGRRLLSWASLPLVKSVLRNGIA